MRSLRWMPRARKCWRTSGGCYEEWMADKDDLGDVLRHRVRLALLESESRIAFMKCDASRIYGRRIRDDEDSNRQDSCRQTGGSCIDGPDRAGGAQCQPELES